MEAAGMPAPVGLTGAVSFAQQILEDQPVSNTPCAALELRERSFDGAAAAHERNKPSVSYSAPDHQRGQTKTQTPLSQ